MNDESTTREKPLPAWVGLTVFILLFGSIALAMGYWAWSKAARPPRSELQEVPALPQIRASDNSAANKTGVVRAQGANGQITYTITAPNATLFIVKSNSQPDWTYTFSYNLEATKLLSADQNAAANARYRLNIDAAFAKVLKVSDDQLARLKAVPPVTTMITADADLNRIKAAFEKHVAQPTAATDAALVRGLEDVANRSLPATRASVAQRVKQIQAILSADQIAQFKTP